jgi:hypothetical protein
MPHPTDGYFPITSLHRDDLKTLGYEIQGVDYATMSELTRKMADAYCENAFWIDLEIIADALRIPKKA